MRFVRILFAVLAVHTAIFAFFCFKPTVRYFTTMCISTILVWAGVFAFKRWKAFLIVAAALVQLSIQHFAYSAWQAEQSGPWWPLVQFISLQYIVVLSLSAPHDGKAA